MIKSCMIIKSLTIDHSKTPSTPFGLLSITTPEPEKTKGEI